MNTMAASAQPATGWADDYTLARNLRRLNELLLLEDRRRFIRETRTGGKEWLRYCSGRVRPSPLQLEAYLLFFGLPRHLDIVQHPLSAESIERAAQHMARERSKRNSRLVLAIDLGEDGE